MSLEHVFSTVASADPADFAAWQAEADAMRDMENSKTAARMGAPSNVTALTEQIGRQTSARDQQEKENKKNGDAMLRQAMLEDLERQAEHLRWLDEQIRHLNTEIADIDRDIAAMDREIAFLRDHDEEAELLDENGELKSEVADYLRSKGRKPEEMSSADILIFMHAEEADLHNARDAKVEDREAKEEKRAGYEDLRDETAKRVEELEEELGIEPGSTYQPPDLSAETDMTAYEAQESATEDLAEAATEETQQRAEATTNRPSQGMSFNSGLG